METSVETRLGEEFNTTSDKTANTQTNGAYSKPNSIPNVTTDSTTNASTY